MTADKLDVMAYTIIACATIFTGLLFAATQVATNDEEYIVYSAFMFFIGGLFTAIVGYSVRE